MSLFDSAISFNYQRRETQVPCCLKCFSLLFLTSYYNPSSHEQQQLYIRSHMNLKNKTLLLSLVKKKEKTPKHSLWPACATAWSAEPWSVLHPSTVPGAAAHPGARQREQPCLWPLQQQKPSAAGRAADNLLNVGLYIHSSWAQWVSAAACPVWKRPLMTAVVTDAYRCRHDFL